VEKQLKNWTTLFKKQPKVINDLMGVFSDWANFDHTGDCFSGNFLDYRGSPNIWTIFFHGKGCVLIWAKKWFGTHFGRFFRKFVWSRCSPFLTMDFIGLSVVYDAKRVFSFFFLSAKGWNESSINLYKASAIYPIN
jgi:hypothetical protein